VNGLSLLAAVTARGHRVVPRLAGRVHTAMFVNTRGLQRVPADICPLGARRVDLTGVPRVAAAYLWGDDDPSVLALHGWGTDSTTMAAVVDAVVAGGKSVVCFDAPGHGVSPGSAATITEYTEAVVAVLQRFPSIHTIVAHSLSAIAAVAAVARSEPGAVRGLLLLAPACSLSGVLDRWAAWRRLPTGVSALIAEELHRRDGVPVSHWDIRTLRMGDAVRVAVVHDPDDHSVPVSDAYQITAGRRAQFVAAPGAGHHGIVGSASMRAALAALLTPLEREQSPRGKAVRS
jgi:pimeloyl-ACP methyl ester carboxylesterase